MSEFYLKNKDEIVAKIVFGDGDEINTLITDATKRHKKI